MKRILIFLLAVISLTSCFKSESGMGQKYTLVASFQYPGIAFRSDSTFVNVKDTIGFGFDVLNFFHNLDGALINLEGGFLISGAGMPKSGNTDRLMKTFRAQVPSDLSEGNVYTVYRQNPDQSKMPAHDIKFVGYSDDSIIEEGTCRVAGCYLTNTVEVAEFVKANFKKGDKLVVKATGYLHGNKTGETEIALADFSEKKDSIVSTWTPFELKKLGFIEYIDFEITSTNPDVPAYFCMDNMVATIDIEY